MTQGDDHSTDRDLLRRYADERADDAFAELVRRHIDLIHSAALRQAGGNESNAADVTQAVFTELARQADQLARHPALTGWLYTTTRRMAAHTVRGEARRRQREQEAHAMQELLRESTAPEPDWAHLLPVLDAAMHDLAEADRLAVLLRHFERRPLAEIGTRLGLSENAARMRVDRALDKLRTCLAERGITSTASALAAALTTNAVTAAPAALASAVTTSTMAAATTTTFGTFTLMASTKLQLTTGAILLVAMGTALVLQHHAATRLRSDNAALLDQIALLTEDAQHARQAAARNLEEINRLRQPPTELLRLRGEVARLRQMAVQSPAQPAPAFQASPTVADSTPPLDLGNDTPENAATTVFAAITQGLRSRFSELLMKSDQYSPEVSARLEEAFFHNMTNHHGGKQFISIDKVQANEDGTVNVGLQFVAPASSAPDIIVLTLKNTESGWLIDPGTPPPEMLEAAIQPASPP